jgi:hypothetical protein
MAVLTVPKPTRTQYEMTQPDRYRLVLLNDAGTHVLLFRKDGYYLLPQIDIPQFTRPAEQITFCVRDLWGFRAILLWAEHQVDAAPSDYYAVLEVYKCESPAPRGFEWFSIQDAALRINEGDARFLTTGHDRTHAPFGADRAPFSRLGCIYRLQEWIESVVGPLGIELRDFRQLNGGGAFSLILFETNKQPLWYKAVGAPNLHEFPITLALARLFAGHVPTILSSDSLLNGWLMESAGTLTLSEVEDLNIWKRTLQQLATLQVASIPQTSKILDKGCRDLRLKELITFIDPFFDVMACLMTQQTKVSPAPLTRTELSEVALKVHDALCWLGELHIPDTLGHRDVNPRNVLVDEGHVVFIDWAEAFVGPPLCTFEYLMAHWRKSSTYDPCQEALLRTAYTEPWLAVVPRDPLEAAMQLSPLIAIYAYAAAGDSWRDPERLSTARAPAFLRSLCRTMKRMADALLERSQSCLR